MLATLLLEVSIFKLTTTNNVQSQNIPTVYMEFENDFQKKVKSSAAILVKLSYYKTILSFFAKLFQF